MSATRTKGARTSPRPKKPAPPPVLDNITIEPDPKELAPNAGQMGRPSSFRPSYIDQVRRLGMLGLTVVEMAEFFGVHRDTINEWRHAFPGFAEAMDEGRHAADARVAESLFKRATGYEHTATKVMQADGIPITHDYTERYPPDTTACIFWLKNRQPKWWRDKVESVLSGDPENPVQIADPMATEQIKRLESLRTRIAERLVATQVIKDGGAGKS